MGGKAKKGGKKGSKKGSKKKTKSVSDDKIDINVQEPEQVVLRGAYVRLALRFVDLHDQEKLPCNFEKVVNIGTS